MPILSRHLGRRGKLRVHHEWLTAALCLAALPGVAATPSGIAPLGVPTPSGVPTPLAVATPGTAAAGGQMDEAVLEVTLNVETKGDTMIVLRHRGGMLYLEESDFAKLRMHVPTLKPYLHEGRRYFAPAAIRGCSVVIDEVRQRAVISVPSSALDTTRLSAAERKHPAITQASPGAFLNYQISSQQVAGLTTGGVFGELGLFAGAGVLTNTALARFVGGIDQAVRLDTTFTHDFPDRLETLQLGDAISDPGTWGYAVRYAGVRWSKNFGLRPDLLTTPLLSTSGIATVPSSVDVFVNHQLVSSNQLPPGPFVIDRLPTVSGTGDVNVVVRDALGREQVLSQSFYSSSNLLARGLTQYSVNVGSVRKDYTLASADYGATLGEASYRRGITDTFTLEGHGEYLAKDAHALGLNAAFGLGHFAVLNVTAAEGGDSAGTGGITGIGIEHRGRNVSFVANTQWASSGFAQVGEPFDLSMRVRQRSLLQTGLGLGRFGSLSLAYVHQTYRSSPAQQVLSLTHTLSLGRAGVVNLTLTQTHSAQAFSSVGQNLTSAYLIYLYSFDGRRSATVTAVGASGGSGSGGSGLGSKNNELIAGFSESPPAGVGSGYRLSASTRGDYNAQFREQLASADLELEAARNQGIEGRSATVTGALTWLDGQLNTTRSVNGSFAMVDVAGIADVPVYVENQLITHTDASGRALLYNLRPYESNRISIAPEDLPLDTTIAASSTIMAPPYRSGVVARFPVERVRSGTFRLITDDGKPLPVGATVKLTGALFPVVLDGLVYVTGYDHGMAAEASWSGGHCSFRLPPPPDDELVPDMGTVSCRSVSAEVTGLSTRR